MVNMKLLLEEMTWPEIRDALNDGDDCVIVPVGSIEQHGYHLPLCTDAALGQNAALELAVRLGNALVAPAVRPGLSEHHMAFPGTLTLRPETFRMLLEDYAGCYIRHGFHKIVFLVSHGGNTTACKQILEDLRKKNPDICFAYAAYFPTSEELKEAETVYALPAGANGGHADDRETSEMLVLRPDLVLMERAAPGFTEPLTREHLKLFFDEGAHSLSEVGCIGDPRGAGAARGKWYIKLAADRLAREVREQLSESS